MRSFVSELATCICLSKHCSSGCLIITDICLLQTTCILVSSSISDLSYSTHPCTFIFCCIKAQLHIRSFTLRLQCQCLTSSEIPNHWRKLVQNIGGRGLDSQ